MSKINIFWLRRDLRTEDNRGFSEALKSEHNVLPIFIFDKKILDKLENKEDKRLDYFHQALEKMNAEFKKHGSGIQTFHGKPLEIFKKIIKDFDIETVYTNTDYEPYAKNRDEEVAKFLKQNDVDFQSFNDQIIFEKDDILKKDGTPYSVYTPYSRKWKEKFTNEDVKPCPLDFKNLYKFSAKNIISLKDLGFKETGFTYEKPVLKKSQIEDYDITRNFPGADKTTRIGVALRFGTISIRECVAFAEKNNEVWLNELIWREFFMQILYHFPKVVTTCFKEDYEKIDWRNNEKEFKLWCEGKTGYPIVDAGMRQLNETGFMHNRIRMVTASFLTKHLLIDWRWGEAYFAEKLLDYELSSNNGNWQWAAGCGCDAAPYFRIFNPAEQSKKFDKNNVYVDKWLDKESKEISPIVEHKLARERALSTYREALKK